MTATAAGPPAMDPPGGNTSSGTPGTGTASPAARGAAGDRAAGGASRAAALAAADLNGRIAALRDRLVSPMPDDRVWGWIGPLVITAFAAYFRFNRLVVPRALIFDETYYAKDAWSILLHGVEWNPVQNANALIIAGHTTHLFQACTSPGCGEYVVQPEVGKLLIAVGEWIWGLNSIGWRVPSAFFGSLAVLVMCRVARRLTRSTLLGCVAGLMLSLDGLEFVLSRTGILDIFLMFFVLAAFGCMLVDRDVSRARLAEAVVLRPVDEAGPQLGIRKWRVAAGLLIGLGCASKQNAVWYIFAFAGLAIAWDLGARRTAGLRDYVRGALIRDGKWLPLTLGVIPLATYILTWSNWLITSTGFYRNYAHAHGVNIPVISGLYSLVEYHVQMVTFGVGLDKYHPYMSQPWGWIVISRPVAFFYECYTGPANYHVCPAGYRGPEWSQEVLAMGNPAIWWVSIPAMLFCLGWWLTRRDWRAGAALLCVAAGWATWLPFVHRTKFDYYSLVFLPFLILCIVLCLGLIIGPAPGQPRQGQGRQGLGRQGLGRQGQIQQGPGRQVSLMRRTIGASVVGGYVLAVLILFWYFYPILAGKIIPYSDWLSHMWYHGWI